MYLKSLLWSTEKFIYGVFMGLYRVVGGCHTAIWYEREKERDKYRERERERIKAANFHVSSLVYFVSAL